MLTVADLPTVNAALNLTAAILLLAGYLFIRRQRVGAHRACMIAAFATSACFLISYLVYHALAGSRSFGGRGLIRPVYFAILASHVILAAIIVPLALMTLGRALRGRFDRHVPLARRTLPLWLYVSVTGVVIYLMLYRLG
jgi:uncharacterized membrane protein YozB (DUF420 family)